MFACAITQIIPMMIDGLWIIIVKIQEAVLLLLNLPPMVLEPNENITTIDSTYSNDIEKFLIYLITLLHLP